MFILLVKEGPYVKEYNSRDEFVEFADYEKYKHLGLVYPFMCIFKDNLDVRVPALLMLSFDSKMRLQYRYNSEHVEQSQRDKIKFITLMIANLKEAVRAIVRDIHNDDDETKQTLALMALVTMHTGIRVGKDVHLKKYDSVGLSTLACKHVKCGESSCTFEFVGKKQVNYVYTIEDKTCVKLLKRIVGRCKSKDEFVFKTRTRKLTYMDFNDYVKDIFKNELVSGKDFRTLLANITFIESFKENAAATSTSAKHDSKSVNKIIKESIKRVAQKLQNTNAVSKKSYVFKSIIEYINSNYENFMKTKDTIQLMSDIFAHTTSS